MSVTIQSSAFYHTVPYLKHNVLKYAKLVFCFLFYVGVKLGLL